MQSRRGRTPIEMKRPTITRNNIQPHPQTNPAIEYPYHQPSTKPNHN